MGHQLDLKLDPDQTYAQLLVHVMAWRSRRFCFRVDETDFHQDLGLATRYPLMIAAVAGHTIPVDLNYLCEKMLRTTGDPFPIMIIHATFFSMLRGITVTEGIVPGGGRLYPRPIHCETVLQQKEGRATNIENSRKFRFLSIPSS